MIPGRWLHHFASSWCSASTCQHIVEPLLSDFQHQWIDSRDRRVSTLVSGYLAFWQMIAVCALRAGFTWLVEAPARLTFERIFVAAYAIAIVLVIVFGFAWVRTGTLDSAAGLIAVRKLAAMFGPGLLLSRSLPRAHDLRAKMLVLFGFGCAMAIACWINGEGRLGVALYNLLYLGMFWRQMAWAATRFHHKRPGSVK